MTNESNTKTAQDFRDEAAAIDRRRIESIERSDTDGFVSQWASGLSRQLALARAELMDNGCLSRFEGLYEGERRVKAKKISFYCGYSHTHKSQWLLDESETDLIAKRGKKYLPDGHRSRVLKNFGLNIEHEMAPAWSKLTGSGRGLSGRAWVTEYRTGCEWGSDATMCEAGSFLKLMTEIYG